MHYTLVHGFCFFKLFPIGCVGLERGFKGQLGKPCYSNLHSLKIFYCHVQNSINKQSVTLA